jgi:hypothetical protein
MTKWDFKPRIGLIVVVSVVIIAGTVTLTLLLKRYLGQQVEQAAALRQQLQNELNRIEPPPSSIPVRHVGGFKGTHGNYAIYYQANLTHDDIRSHYDRELAKHGWKLKKESKLTTWGGDKGESQRIQLRLTSILPAHTRMSLVSNIHLA